MAVQLKTGADFNNQRGINLASPSASTDAVNKSYVDNLVGGLAWKNEVRAASTANVTLATAVDDGSTLDGVTLATGDRILLKNQTDPIENGIWIVAASGAPARASDADAAGDLNNATVAVTEGSVNEGLVYTQNEIDPAPGTDANNWVLFGAGQTYSADGEGIEETGGEFSLELDGTTLSKSSSGLRIGSGAAGAGLTESSGVLAVGQGTGVTVNANDVAIDTAVVTRKYSTAIGNGSNTTLTVTHNLGTRDVTVQIYEAADPWAQVLADVFADTTNTVDITFASAPSSSQYRVIVTG